MAQRLSQRILSAKVRALFLFLSPPSSSSFLPCCFLQLLLCCASQVSSPRLVPFRTFFAHTLLASDRHGLGSRSGCSSLTMVMNPDSVCSSSLVLHRDSGWDCRTKAKETQILGLSTAKGGLSSLQTLCLKDLPRMCRRHCWDPCSGHYPLQHPVSEHQ